QGRPDRVDRDRSPVELLLVADLPAEALILAPRLRVVGRRVDEIEQPLGLERLLDEVDRPFPDRRDRGVEVAVARDHQHRKRRIAALDLLQQLQPVQPRALQPDVQQDHRRAPLLDRVERGSAVGRGAHGIALLFQYAADQVADVGLVIHHQHFKRHQPSPSPSSLLCSAAEASSLARASSFAVSNEIRTWVPPPGRSRKAISPICSSTIFLTIARPSPVPRTRVVIYGSVRRSRSSGRPTPVSSTSMTRWLSSSCSFSSMRAPARLCSPRFIRPSMASTPFLTTLVSACASCRRSQTMRKSPSGGSSVNLILGCATSCRNRAWRAISCTSSSRNTGLGMRAKLENSSTMRRRSPTWRMIVLESCSNVALSEVISAPNLRCIRSAASWIGVSGFLISWAMRRAMSDQAARRWSVSWSVMSSKVSTDPSW